VFNLHDLVAYGVFALHYYTWSARYWVLVDRLVGPWCADWPIGLPNADRTCRAPRSRQGTSTVSPAHMGLDLQLFIKKYYVKKIRVQGRGCVQGVGRLPHRLLRRFQPRLR
jgi:hypothetical protein